MRLKPTLQARRKDICPLCTLDQCVDSLCDVIINKYGFFKRAAHGPVLNISSYGQREYTETRHHLNGARYAPRLTCFGSWSEKNKQ